MRTLRRDGLFVVVVVVVVCDSLVLIVLFSVCCRWLAVSAQDSSRFWICLMQ